MRRGILVGSLLIGCAIACRSGDTEVPPPVCNPPPRPGSASIALVPALGGQGFDHPTEIARGPGDRLYVLEQLGRVRVVSVDGSPSILALDITASITGGGEAGLLGIAFDPAFADNGFVYLDYTVPLAEPRAGVVFQSVVARWHSADGGATIDPASEKRLLVVDQPFPNHNGGHLAFGPDKLLYISFGDGGSGGDPNKNGQNKDVLLGKLLRIDPSGGEPYGIPAGNPFASGGGRGEIFAYGLRNTWKFSFDRATGDLWAGDVGQDKFEEVDRIVVGGDYGWNVREGFHCYNATTCATEGLLDPIAEYPHSQGISITGGFVYRGTKIADLAGKYVYGDFGSGRMWSVTAQGGPELLLESALKISTFAEDGGGELYVADYVTGQVSQLVQGAPSPFAIPGAQLSQTQCFDVEHPDVPPRAAIPYDVSSPLWSDGAEKSRWVFVPPGTKAHVNADGDLDFPNGTVAVKTFRIGGKKIETRLFARYADGSWHGWSYEWSDDEKDAALLDDRKTKTLATGEKWTFPSRADCLACHTGVAGFTLGLEARQLDHGDQLARFAGVVDAPIAAGAFPPLGTDGRSYLHANCSFCHREGSGAGAATLDLRIDRSLADTRTCDVDPAAGDLGIAGAKLIAPGDPSRSIVLARMRTLDQARMPPVATHVVDGAGTGAVEAWIASLTGCP